MLFIKAETENIGEIRLRTDANLRIDVRNSLSDWEQRENVIVNPSETEEQDDETTREPPAHLSIKWEGSKKASVLRCLDAKETATALKKKKKHKHEAPRAFTGDDSSNDEWVPILAVECRGLEPYAFRPMRDEFVIVSSGGENGCVFDEEIEFEDGEWVEYDAENDYPVSISELQFKFEAV